MRARRGQRDNAPRLHQRFTELTGRYQALLDRVSDVKRNESAFFRLSWFALQRSSSALAMFREGHVVMANMRWHELASARLRDGNWIVDGDDEASEYCDLATLSLRAMERTRVGAPLTLRCRSRDGKVFRLRLERVTRPREEAVALVLADDTTEETERERAMSAMHDSMSKRQQMSALGRLAAGVAHDLGNTLGSLALRLDAFPREADGAGGSHVHAIRQAVQQMQRTLDRLAEFSARKLPPARPTELRTLIRRAVALAGLKGTRADGKGRITVELQLPRRLPRVMGDPVELINVLVNLLNNARDAMERGTIIIAVEVGAERVRLRVLDEGCGFAPEDIERVFEPFFTTKGSRGTGLGLSLAYTYLEVIGGSIRVANRSPHGAEVTVELRRADVSVLDPADARRRVPRRRQRLQ